MGQYNLNRVMGPRQVAVIGASEKTGSIGNVLVRNLLDGGFAGRVLPVNPNYAAVYGLPAVRSVSDLEPGVDLLVIATPIRTVPDIVQECAGRDIGGVVVISAGGKEAGAAGRGIEERIGAAARAAGVRVIGPNCLGLIRPGEGLNATFVTGMPVAGNLAFVSQSGAICSAILDLAFKERIGFSHFVSIGSMVDVDFGDMIDFLGADYAVKSILLYIENLSNFRKFMSAARAVSRVKPIIVLKAGRSPAGARAAASHTGAMVGEDQIYDAAFKRAGVVRVDTIEELFDCAELLAKMPRPRGARLAIVSNGGGPGVMAADFLARHDREPAPLAPETVTRLNAVLPPYWSGSNPVDILGDAPASRFQQVLDICLEAREFDALLMILAPQALTASMAVAEILAASRRAHRPPIFACWMGGRSTEQAVAFLNGAGVPTFATPERAIRAYLSVIAFNRHRELLLEVPPKLTKELVCDRLQAEGILGGAGGQRPLSEAETRAILAAYGLPVIRTERAESEEQASRLGREIGYPLAAKLCSPDISHKTEAGGVCLDLRSDAEVRGAYRQIIDAARRYRPAALIEGIVLQPFIAAPDYEIMLGAKRDHDFGPVLLFGMGGIFTEVLRDTALGLPPMNRLLARRLMQETRVNRVLQGFRHRPAADCERLEEMIVRLSQLLIDLPQIAELDMNPVLIRAGIPVVADYRLLVAPSPVAAPHHLVISAYPEEFECRETSAGGLALFIRPVKPEDAPLFVGLFRELSPTSIYYRFFGAIKELPPEMLARFTQVDYDREIALVALDGSDERERLLGVARIIGDPDGREGEFAVLVGDAWQGKGIGAGLLRHCLQIAESRGFSRVHGIVLKENRNMLALGRKLGFVVARGEDSGEYELQIDLGRHAVGAERWSG